MSVVVEIDGTDVSSCVQSGSVTRRLNRAALATARLYSECTYGDSLSKMKVTINGDLFFHGFVTQISTEAGEDGALISEYSAQDPMFLWQWRPARDGAASGDQGDFSNPDFINRVKTGPEIMAEILDQSVNGTAPNDAEGTLFIDLAASSFATGVVDLSGAPTDWPMTIAEVFELLASTGVLDAVLSPIDSGGNMAVLDVYNGDFGTDLTATVNFDYATGDRNVKSVRMVEDSSNICNKLWYYLGPRVKTPLDPGGDQHWRANVQGFDSGLAIPPWGKSVDASNNPMGPPWTDNNLGEQIYNSRIASGVRMELRIYDAQGDENPAAYRELYRRLWQMESWLRSQPRTLIHVTPVRESDNMQLPPGVVPVQVGAFDIGDLVAVNAGTILRGGFSGAQRIYEYTVSWDEDGILELGELLTSADQENL